MGIADKTYERTSHLSGGEQQRVGFVSAGGLGREFRLSLSYFHYTDFTLLIAWYLILVVAVDLLSAWLRRLVTAEE